MQAAEKELDGKTLTDAKAKVSAAQGIVDQQEKQAKGKGGDKDRASALDAVLRDIKAAAKDINARKTGDAKGSLQSAITGLEALTGKGKDKKDKGKKKN